MARRRKRVEFRVSFRLPEGATVADAKDYVEDAVHSWAGSLKPTFPPSDYDDPNWVGDPMFELDRDSIKVVRLRKPTPEPNISAEKAAALFRGHPGSD